MPVHLIKQFVVNGFPNLLACFIDVTFINRFIKALAHILIFIIATRLHVITLLLLTADVIKLLIITLILFLRTIENPSPSIHLLLILSFPITQSCFLLVIIKLSSNIFIILPSRLKSAMLIIIIFLLTFALFIFLAINFNFTAASRNFIGCIDIAIDNISWLVRYLKLNLLPIDKLFCQNPHLLKLLE